VLLAHPAHPAAQKDRPRRDLRLVAEQRLEELLPVAAGELRHELTEFLLV
jgi:hypothetical protein